MILTFDDGPSEWTPAILDLLAEFDICATFFVVGRNALENPHHLRRAAAEGHEVGNHTWSHPELSRLSGVEAFAELWACSQLLAALLGEPPAAWRAPYLAQGQIVRLPRGLGEHCGADVCPDDFAREDPEEIARIVLAEAGPESVVCLHDGVPPNGGSARCLPSRAPTVAALRLILEEQR